MIMELDKKIMQPSQQTNDNYLNKEGGNVLPLISLKLNDLYQQESIRTNIETDDRRNLLGNKQTCPNSGS